MDTFNIEHYMLNTDEEYFFSTSSDSDEEDLIEDLPEKRKHFTLLLVFTQGFM